MNLITEKKTNFSKIFRISHKFGKTTNEIPLTSFTLSSFIVSYTARIQCLSTAAKLALVTLEGDPYKQR